MVEYYRRLQCSCRCPLIPTTSCRYRGSMGPDGWTRSRIWDDLRTFGVRSGQALMVHASLRAIGRVEDGADALIDAVSPDGTLLMVLGLRDDFAFVNEHPEADRPALLAGSPPFDALVTPADPEVGTLAEVFRQHPAARVSDHPDGRFAAIGSRADGFVAGVPWNDYYGHGSPLERLVEADGRLLRMGADASTVTLIHYAEAIVDLPAKARVRRHHLVSTADGPQIRVTDTLDDDDGIVEHPGGDYFADFLVTGSASTGTVGGAASELFDARELVDFAVTWMGDRLAGPI